MSTRIQRIRQRLSLGYYREGRRMLAAPDIRHLLEEVDRLRAKLPEAWAEGTRAEAEARDGAGKHGYVFTFMCSMGNPYLDWSEPDEEGYMHSTPTADPFKEAQDG